MTICASYVRVSSNPQTERFGLQAQIEAIKSYADSHGLELRPDLQFQDVGPGSEWSLPGLSALRDAAKSRRFTRLLIAAPDRLARDFVKALVIERELQEAGVTVTFLTIPADADTPASKFLRGNLMLVAEMENADRVRRTSGGRNSKARDGKIVGSHRQPYGYVYAKDQRGRVAALEIDPITGPVVQRLYRELPSTSANELALRLTAEGIPAARGGSWRANSIGRLIRSTTYKGEHRYGSVTVPCPALVDDHTWHRANDALDQRRMLRTKRARIPVEDDPFVLRSRMVCGHCLGALSCFTQSRTKIRYYVCYRAMGRGARLQYTEKCQLPMIPAEPLETWLADSLHDNLAGQGAVKRWLMLENERRKKLMQHGRIILRQIIDHERRIRNLVGQLSNFEPKSVAALAVLDQIKREEAILARLEAERAVPEPPIRLDGLSWLDDIQQTPEQVELIRDLISEQVRGIRSVHVPTLSRIRPTIERLNIQGTLRKADPGQGIRFGKHEVHVSLDLDLSEISTTIFIR